MKKLSLLVFSTVLAAIAVSCTKENASDLKFAGMDVQVGEYNVQKSHLLILNEGAFPGASTLDLLDLAHSKYYADIFGQANPEVEQGIGNTGNDMLIVGNNLWVVLNASNQVAVINLKDFKLKKTITVESPRFIVSDGSNVYITSYGAAIYNGDPVKGKVYKISVDSYESQTADVGYQPEGLALLNGKLYVANSGGYNYVHDNTITVLNTASMSFEKTIELPVTNLFQMYAAGGAIWVNSYGESSWSQDANEQWIESPSAPKALVKVTPEGNYTIIDGVHAYRMTNNDNIIYALGNDQEMTGGYDFCLYKINALNSAVMKKSFSEMDITSLLNPYGLLVSPDNGDLFICDASYSGESKLHCFGLTDAFYKYKWSVNTGVCTGHLLLY